MSWYSLVPTPLSEKFFQKGCGHETSLGRGQLYPRSNQDSSPACWYIEHEPENKKKKKRRLRNKAEETSLCIYDTVNTIILLSKTWITCLTNLRKCCWSTPTPFSTPSLSLPHAGQTTKESRSVSRSWCWVGLSQACSQSRGWGTWTGRQLFWLFMFFLQERLQYIAEFSRKPHLSTMLAADTNQTATNIAEQLFSIYRHDLCV